MPQVKSGFTLKSKSPNFERDCFKNLEEMRNVNVAHMDEGHICYCTDTKKHYIFDSEITDINLGPFKIFESGGGDCDCPNYEDRIKSLEDKINSIYDSLYPISCFLKIEKINNKTIASKPTSYVAEYKQNENITALLNYGVNYKGVALDTAAVDSLVLEKSDDSINMGSYGYNSESTNNVEVRINSNPVGTHKIKLKVSAKGQNISSECTIYQRAPMYIGWHTSDIPTIGMLQESSFMKKVVNTTTSGTYEYKNVPKGHYFWTLIPFKISDTGSSAGIKDTVKNATGGGASEGVTPQLFPMILIEQTSAEGEPILECDNIIYKCYRTEEANGLDLISTWITVL